MFPTTVTVDGPDATNSVEIVATARNLEAASAVYDLPSKDGSIVATPQLTVRSTQTNGLALTNVKLKDPVPDSNGDYKTSLFDQFAITISRKTDRPIAEVKSRFHDFIDLIRKANSSDLFDQVFKG